MFEKDNRTLITELKKRGYTYKYLAWDQNILLKSLKPFLCLNIQKKIFLIEEYVPPYFEGRKNNFEVIKQKLLCKSLPEEFRFLNIAPRLGMGGLLQFYEDDAFLSKYILFAFSYTGNKFPGGLLYSLGHLAKKYNKGMLIWRQTDKKFFKIFIDRKTDN
jgi:hypothetical protein